MPGERVWRTDLDGKPTLYAYDEAGRLLGEYNNTGGLISEVIWLDDLPVGVRRAGVVYPIEPDHLGTPRTIHNQNTLLWHWDLLGPVFGEHAPNDTPSGTQFRFDLRYPGQQYDPTSGLHYNYFRDYEPGTGRYVQSDPIGLRGGLGTYGYAGSRSLTSVDRFGLFAIRPFEERGRGIGGTVICDGYLLTYELYWSEPCTRDCAVVHEESHLLDIRGRNPGLCSANTYNEKSQVVASSQPEQDWTEHTAHSKELICLSVKEEECPEGDCSGPVRARMEEVQTIIATRGWQK